MDETRYTVANLRKSQGPDALRSLRDALTEHVEDVNRRLNAGLTVVQTETTLEVHEVEKHNALLRLTLTAENNIHYTQLVKRHNEMQSGMIYVRACQDGSPEIMFADFPRP